jgi:hypothetical protein
MALFTTFCKECAGVALLDERSAKQGRLSCPRCGSHVAIVPGCSFTTDEQELFDDLVEVAREGALQPGRPRQLASEVAQTLRAGTDTGPLLERLTVPFPGLLPIQTAAARNESERRRVLRVMRAVLEAMSLEGT